MLRLKLGVLVVVAVVADEQARPLLFQVRVQVPKTTAVTDRKGAHLHRLRALKSGVMYVLARS